MLHIHPDFVVDGQNGDVADDSYHRYKEDIAILKELGANFYRFSISWPRIMPTGEANNINQAGIDYYNKLINELVDNGIQPMVSMYHWDLPQWLQDLGGWTNPIITDYFEDYARVLYENFGDRVKLWVTFNEPATFMTGYTSERGMAPSIFKPGVGDYLTTHHLLIAHARAYHLYDEQYRATQQGKISITLSSSWEEPLTNSTAGAIASERSMQFVLGIHAHPIYSKEGDYPAVVRERVIKNSKAEGRTRSRLPVFSKEMVEYIRGTYDYFALNYYTSHLVTEMDTGYDPSIERDCYVARSFDPSWPKSSSEWLRMVPWGLRKLINWIHKEYDGPEIIITENGVSDRGTLDDQSRVSYYTSHLAEILKAIHEDGCNVGGFTAWSLMDNF
ncbi:myrosinase 1-like [Anabrus simplex]|uniref:myrosinase 1-like n=1 Tax=Anabrus simplex TaxID=316456 RepID=UPI0035A32E0A